MPIRREVYVSSEGMQGIGCQCKVDSDRIPMHVGDDFKIVYQFMDSRYSPALMIPLDTFEFQVDYYIKGNPKVVYPVVKNHSVLVNCIVVEKMSIIKAIFKKHNLGEGQLWGRFTFSYPDQDFPGGYGKSIVDADTGITLVDMN